MDLIYNYHPETGESLGKAAANVSPREEDVLLVPAFAAPEAPPVVGDRQCACYLDAAGQVPADYQAGAWQIVPDWRGVLLWSMASGDVVAITLPNVLPADIGATAEVRPGVAHVWRDGEWVADAALQRQQLEDLAARQLVTVNAGAALALSLLSAAYPDGEVQSWAQQTREADALVADPRVPAPLLSAIAAARGLVVTDLAARVLAKVQAYAVASGQIIGQRQALEDAISAVDLAAPDAADQLAAIQWPGVSQ